MFLGSDLTDFLDIASLGQKKSRADMFPLGALSRESGMSVLTYYFALSGRTVLQMKTWVSVRAKGSDKVMW